jgi:hypothetical protein
MMSDGDFQREDRIYLPFIFEDEVIEPEQYLAWRVMIDEYELEKNMRDHGREFCEL